LLGSAIIVQDAGYGIEVPAYGANLQSLSGASLSNGRITGTMVAAGVSANALIWTSVTEGTTYCAGILAPSSGGLIYLGPVSCSTAADWRSLTWNSKTLASTSNFTSSISVTLKAEASNCTPYGLTGTQATYRLSLTATNSSGVALNATHCLQNFQ